jgi:hypothetical protein
MRSAAAAPEGGDRQAGRIAAAQQELARVLDRVADGLRQGADSQDAESRQLGERLARAQELREELDRLSRQLDALNQQARADAGAQQGAAQAGEVARLRDDYGRRMREAADLLRELQRDGTSDRAGIGFTFEGQGMTLSAPGTEAFKQDFAKWEELRRQATQALDRAETSLAQRLAARLSRDRLSAGVDGKPPADYQQQVDNYFKAIAGQRRP